MPTYTTRNNQRIETDSELGKGGEGAVYSLRQSMIHVAKIYHPSHRTTEKEQKLLAMVSNPPSDDTRQFNPPHISISWPEELLYENGRFVGYTMSKIMTSPEIFEVFNPATRKKKYPNFDWRYAHRVAQNLAIALNALHARGYVMGDVNQKNVLVADSALITIVDTDSFQVRDSNGRVYRCPVGVPEYTPPELQGISLSSINRFEYHDNFGLAVLIFQLLMDGNHPFMGVPQNLQQSFGKVDQHCIKQGIFPYQSNRGFLPPPHAPRFETLHPNLQNLFLQTFVNGFKMPTTRTEALDWVHAIETAENALIQCQRNPAHWYSNHSPMCHWCEREKRGGVVPTQRPLTPSTPVLQPPAPVRKTAVSAPRASNSSLLLWMGIASLVFVLFLVWLIARAFSPEPPIIFIETETALVAPLVTTVTSLAVTEAPAATDATVATEVPALGIGSTKIGADGATLVYVPEGEFTMGSDNGEANEKPVHQVYLDAYWIDQTEVTNQLFSSFVSATGYQTDAKKAGWSYVWNGSRWVKTNGADWQHPMGPGSNVSSRDQHPVIHVSWNDAVAYCSWAGRRLPTEAEWEKAARGTDGRTYPWGEYISCDKANYNESCVGDTTKVGSYPNGVSPYGVYDMAGNVWEWVNDWYGETYYQSSPSSNPLGPNFGEYRVLLGGSWGDYSYNVRSALRNMSIPSLTYTYYFGFRCSRSLPLAVTEAPVVIESFIATETLSPIFLSESTCSSPTEWVAQSTNLGAPPTRIGRPDGDGWAANVEQDQLGYLQYGPYITNVNVGDHVVTWALMIDNNSYDNLPIVRLEVSDYTTGATIFASRIITRREWSKTFEHECFSLPFNLDSSRLGHSLEFRIFWYDHAYVHLTKVGLK